MSQSGSMRAVVLEGERDAGTLALKEVPKPIPGPGEILARVCTSGVNRADLLQRRRVRLADCLLIGAAGVETAAGWWVYGAGHISLQDNFFPPHGRIGNQ